MPISERYRNNAEVKQALEDAWLNIDIPRGTRLPNVLDWPREFNHHPEQYISWVMSQPDYFYLTCSEIMGITLSPTQCVVLKELWNRKFPMYIASRGFGKALKPDTNVRVLGGWKKLEDINPGDKVYGGNGKLCNVTGVTRVEQDLEFYRLTFMDGRTIDCCENHQWKIYDNNIKKWTVLKTKDMIERYYYDKHKKGRSAPHREYRYAIPVNGPIDEPGTLLQFSPARSVFRNEKTVHYFDDITSAKLAQHKFLSEGAYCVLRDKKLDVYDKEPTTALGRSRQDKVYICNIEYIGKADGLCICVDSPDNTYIVDDYIVTHNSFLLGVYCLLRLMFMPKRKVVVAGAAFRQSKIIFEYMESIYNNAPRLRDLFKGGRNGPRHETDNYRFYFNEAVVVAIPIGCLVEDSLVTTNTGIKTIKSLRNNFDRVWSNQQYENVGRFFDNGLAETKKIITRKGYEIEGTFDHKVKVLENLEIKWKKFKDILPGDRVLIDRTPRWFNPSFDCTEEQAYVLGAMIGDGSYCNKYHLQFTNIDFEIVSKVKKILYKLKTYDGLHYYHLGKNDVKNWLDFWGLKKARTTDKVLPESILSSSKQNMSACLRGLFDTDGHVYTDTSKGGITISVNFTNTSQILVKQMQYILLHYGIISTINSRVRSKNSNRIYELGIYGKSVKIFYEQIGFYCKRKQDKLEKAILKRKRWVSNGLDSIPDIKYILLDIAKNNKLDGQFSFKNVEIRKSITFSYLKKFVKECVNKNVVHSLFNKLVELTNENIFYDEVTLIENGILQPTYDLNIPSNNEYCANGFYSHNSGEKIRGLRANDLITDEFNSINREIFETVLAGFTAVSANPIKNQQNAAAKKLAIMKGWWEDEVFDTSDKDNQLIISGTAGYSFQHFYKYWQDWHDIVTSRGDKRKLENYFKRRSNESGMEIEEVAETLNWKNYSVIRIPFKMIPEGVMDADSVARARATMHSGTFQNEYGACGYFENDLFFTNEGCVPYKDLKIGDFVLSRNGKFNKITKKTSRLYKGKMFNIGVHSSNMSNVFTKDHLLFTEDEYIPCDNLRDEFIANPKLNDFSGLSEIDVRDYTFSGVYYDKHTYTRYPKNKITQCQIDNILRLRHLRKCDISKTLDIKFPSVSTVLNNNNTRKKCSINRYIKLDYSFGLLIGYYAGDGSVGANGRALNIDLGKHETDFQEEVCYAFKKVFGINCKKYYKQEVCSITINSRVLGELFSNICPGNAYSKFVKPEILYSNKNFMKGFVVGLMNADGCLNKHFGTCQLTNPKLTGQLKMCLSHFDIACSFHFYERKSGIIKGKIAKLSDVYRVDIHSDYYNRFLERFYPDLNLRVNSKNKYLYDDNNYIYDKIKHNDSFYHDGLVFNLEVENEPSYTTCVGISHNCFANDSNGFFKRSLIESCTVSNGNDIFFKSCGKVEFEANLYGHLDHRYVFGVDPASEVDNFSIVVLELWPEHRRIVYCWTTNKSKHREEVKAGLAEENDYYSYCARKIRNLMKRFPCERIMMDSQGGGYAVLEKFRDKKDLQAGEVFLLPVVDPKKPQETDMYEGNHIVELVNFRDNKWTGEANHGMRKDFENKVLLFPYFDAVSLAQAEHYDNVSHIYDSLEDVYIELQELKDELSNIVQTQTPSGLDKWDTPEQVMPGGKKGRMRKDRYSSLVIANMGARILQSDSLTTPYESWGGFSSANKQDSGNYYNNEFFSKWANEFYKD